MGMIYVMMTMGQWEMSEQGMGMIFVRMRMDIGK